MGLLDSLLGAVMSGQQPQSSDNAASGGLGGRGGLPQKG